MTDNETLRSLPAEQAEDGSITAATFLSPTDNKNRGAMCVRPTTVVPVIFIPGIMGSNLRNAMSKESIWNVNSVGSVFQQWFLRSERKRQKRLSVNDAEVDDRGEWYGRSATVPTRAVAKQRGQGTTSRVSYGEFVRWLDDQLNAEVEKPGLEGDMSVGPPGLLSPWQAFFYGEHQNSHWNAEKPFQPITQKESDFAWGNFFCPVHVQGYNWLQSNKQSGADLASAINRIIDYWNQQTICGYRCEKVILVTHSMGGLTARAAVHAAMGNAADQVLGIVHGEMPADGAAASYHHCRSGYGGVTGLVLGRNAAQVTAVFANSPGAMELLPNQQYYAHGDFSQRRWLKFRQRKEPPIVEWPRTDPYDEIYLQKDAWWRLVDPKLIDPAKKHPDDWATYKKNLSDAQKFHKVLATSYHPQTYVHYGADAKKHPTYSDLIWQENGRAELSADELRAAPIKKGSDSDPIEIVLPRAVTETPAFSTSDDLDPPIRYSTRFRIVDPGDVGYPQPGDGTVPACSGEAPFRQGGNNVQQSFRLSGFDHQASYDNEDVRHCTLYAIGKLLQKARVL